MNSVEQFINSLTEEEKILHKDIIEECRQREQTLLQNKKQANNNVQKLSMALRGIVVGLSNFSVISDQITTLSKEIEDKKNLIKLSIIDDDQFYHS